MSDAVAAMHEGAVVPGGSELRARGAARGGPGDEEAWTRELAMGRDAAAGATATEGAPRDGDTAGAPSVRALDVIARGVLYARAAGIAGEAPGAPAESSAVSDDDGVEPVADGQTVDPADAAALMARFAALEQTLTALSEDMRVSRQAVQPDRVVALPGDGETAAIAPQGLPAGVSVRAFSTHFGSVPPASAAVAGMAVEVTPRAHAAVSAPSAQSSLQPVAPAAGEETGSGEPVGAGILGEGRLGGPALVAGSVRAGRGGGEAGTATGGSFGDAARGSAGRPERAEGERATADLAHLVAEAHEFPGGPAVAGPDGLSAAAFGAQVPGGHVAGQIATATLNALSGAVQPGRDGQAAAAAATSLVRADLPPGVPAVVRHLTIDLEPGDLGRVSIDLRLKGDRLEIAFLPEKGGTQRIIEDQLGDIGKRLADAGFALDATAVRSPDRADAAPATSDQSGSQKSFGETAFGQDGRGFGRNRGREEAMPDGAGSARERQPPSTHGELRPAAVAGAGRFI